MLGHTHNKIPRSASRVAVLVRTFLPLALASAMAEPANALAADSQVAQKIRALEAQIKTLEAAYADYREALQQTRVQLLDLKTLAAQRGRGTGPQQQISSASAPVASTVQPEVQTRPKASKSAQAVYQEQNALFEHKLTIEPGITYTYTNRNQLTLNGFLALDAIFLGNISVDRVKSHILTFNLDTRYGVTPNLQLDFNMPFLYRYTVFEAAGQNSSGDQRSEGSAFLKPRFSLGDVSAGIYYKFLHETTTLPDMVWNFQVKAPTGTSPYGIKLVQPQSSNTNLQYPDTLPSGSGVWAVTTGLSAVKTTDPAILFANLGYTYNIPRHFSDISSQAGQTTPGDVKLGDSVQYGMGIGFALNETTSMSFGYSQMFQMKSRTRVDGGGWQGVIGSEANAAMLNIGATHALNDHSSAVVNVGIGLTADAPDIQLDLKFPYQF